MATTDRSLMHDEQTRCVAVVLERMWVEWNKTTRAMNSKGVVVVVYWTMEHITWGCFVVCVNGTVVGGDVAHRLIGHGSAV